MNLRRVALALLACVTFVPVAPVYAAEPTVASGWGPAFTRWIGDGSDTVLAGGVCSAKGVGAAPGQVAVATRVRCTINGTQRSASAPGPNASTTVVVAAVPPVVMCHGGSAVFIDATGESSELVYVDVPDRCYVHPV